MSVGGPALFDDDLAADVQLGYRQLLEDRVPDDEATRRTIEGWSGLDPDEEPVFWLALAAAQFRFGRLEPDVRDRALAVIDTGVDLSRWQHLASTTVDARAAVLADLRRQLTGPQPPRRTVRRPWRYVTDLLPGTVLTWRASTGIVIPLRVVQIRDDRTMAAPILEQLAWSGSDVPPQDVLAALPRATIARRAGAHVAGPVYGPFKWKRRDPDWADAGFTICGSVPPRPGDDGDFMLGTSFLMWGGLPLHLEYSVTGRWPAGEGSPAGI